MFVVSFHYIRNFLCSFYNTFVKTDLQLKPQPGLSKERQTEIDKIVILLGHMIIY